MKQVAVLLDGGYVCRRLRIALRNQHATAAQIVDFAKACVAKDEELFRIYFYDCPPWEQALRHPLTGNMVPFKGTSYYQRVTELHRQLRASDHVAFRKGELKGGSWKVDESFTKALRHGEKRTLKPADLKPDFKQKRVDMMIGLDIAWLSSKQIVHKLIMVTGDTDFVPAMKFARREGVQVVMVPLDGRLTDVLREHADETRTVPFPAPTPP